MPIFFRASFTSSSLNGWMIASIFFISRFLIILPLSSGFENVSFFAVLAEIEALLLVTRIHAHTNQRIAHLKDNECPRCRENDRNSHACRLIQNLYRVSVHQ